MFSVDTATLCTFARDCMWSILANEQISGELHQRLSELFSSHTQDMLNILTGSLLQTEQHGEPVVVHDEEKFSGECLTDEEGKIIHDSRSRLCSQHKFT